MLLIGFAVMDGFDLGTGMLLPFIARTDSERRIVINTVGPVWEGNQVWLILGAGAIFAAWPAVYATAFSGFYLAMFVVLCSLILRPVGFKFRSKMPGPRWRETWDWLLFLGGFVPALIFGVAVGNALRGVPFRFDETLRLTYEGGLIGLLNPYALLCGLVSVTMLVMHGGAWLAVKAEEPVAGRARRTAFLASFLLILLFALAGLWTGSSMGYRITGALVHDGPSNPLGKTAEAAAGAWLANYSAFPLTMLAPLARRARRAAGGGLHPRRPARRPGLDRQRASASPGWWRRRGSACSPSSCPPPSIPGAASRSGMRPPARRRWGSC